jgi:hypothetical protein
MASDRCAKIMIVHEICSVLCMGGAVGGIIAALQGIRAVLGCNLYHHSTALFRRRQNRPVAVIGRPVGYQCSLVRVEHGRINRTDLATVNHKPFAELITTHGHARFAQKHP